MRRAATPSPNQNYPRGAKAARESLRRMSVGSIKRQMASSRQGGDIERVASLRAELLRRGADPDQDLDRWSTNRRAAFGSRKGHPGVRHKGDSRVVNGMRIPIEAFVFRWFVIDRDNLVHRLDPAEPTTSLCGEEWQEPSWEDSSEPKGYSPCESCTSQAMERRQAEGWA